MPTVIQAYSQDIRLLGHPDHWLEDRWACRLWPSSLLWNRIRPSQLQSSCFIRDSDPGCLCYGKVSEAENPLRKETAKLLV